MVPASLRSRSHVKASMILTIDDPLCLHNYIRALLNIILRPIGSYLYTTNKTIYCIGSEVV